MSRRKRSGKLEKTYKVPTPKRQVAKLESKHEALIDGQGSNARGRSFIELEICGAITTERRRSSVLELGNRRRWPNKIDPYDIRDRIFSKPLDMNILNLFLNPPTLNNCAVWSDFLLSIDFKLVDFIQLENKYEFPKAIRHKSCGYSNPHSYGPQGSWVMYSSLLRLIAENEDDYDLEQSLFNTIGSIIADDKEHFPDFIYDDDCCLSLKDFIDFVLVPFVAVSLIADDVPGFDLQDAIFERNNSHEFGEIFHAEDDSDDDSDEQAHNVHKQNMLAVRSYEREHEEPAFAPPLHRKPKLEAAAPIPTPTPKFKAIVSTSFRMAFLIRLPASFKPIAEEEIIIKDFEPASKPRVTKEATKTSNPTRNIISEPRYGTRGSKRTSGFGDMQEEQNMCAEYLTKSFCCAAVAVYNYPTPPPGVHPLFKDATIHAAKARKDTQIPKQMHRNLILLFYQGLDRHASPNRRIVNGGEVVVGLRSYGGVRVGESAGWHPHIFLNIHALTLFLGLCSDLDPQLAFDGPRPTSLCSTSTSSSPLRTSGHTRWIISDPVHVVAVLEASAGAGAAVPDRKSTSRLSINMHKGRTGWESAHEIPHPPSSVLFVARIIKSGSASEHLCCAETKDGFFSLLLPFSPILTGIVVAIRARSDDDIHRRFSAASLEQPPPQRSTARSCAHAKMGSSLEGARVWVKLEKVFLGSDEKYLLQDAQALEVWLWRYMLQRRFFPREGIQDVPNGRLPTVKVVGLVVEA
ncbi:hypothetical protein B0H13DRAFT_1887051 [Mycena leptocephala]|nr:hypothetical protein B0H13DRAFT_1887051 [Mycena leptocephala]